MKLRLALLAALALSALAVAGGASAAGSGAGQGNNPREETIAYWTPERVAKAKPRDLFVDQNGKIVRNHPGVVGEKGKPGGGGGGSTTTVKGAPWTGGGLIQATEGKVLFTMGGTDYVCSGTVVSDGGRDNSLVLTAGHCVYDEGVGFASNWMFMPAFEDAPSAYNGGFNCAILTYGCWTASALVTSDGWRSGDFNEDYGFAVIPDVGGDSLEGVVGGAHGIAFSSSRPSPVHAFGYPAASPYDGTDLIYCAGNTVADTWGGSTSSGLACNMTGGSSGGGWMAPFTPATGIGTLVSVNSFKYIAGPLKNHMFGPRFDGDAQATYTAALGATSNGFGP